jgi:cytochrome c551
MENKQKAKNLKQKTKDSATIQYFVFQTHTNNLKISTYKPANICFLLFASCLLLSNCSRSKKDFSPKFTQYYNQGETLYQKHCSNCHQKDGTGLGRLYPPLSTSDYMDRNFKDVVCLMRYGKKGEMIVNGKNFNHAMPGIASLTDLEIAEIATYIYNTWNHQRGMVEVKEVTELLKACTPVE